ncbi:hypothetical protein [Specibacter sp. RAF43]|uniref:hypothetical protein n=1 Tax=Specibacter sp. RAF43 TaxID=3233057 RepID=UPI003F9DACFE
MSNFQVPEFIRAESKYVREHDARRLSRLAAAGDIVRIRRGLYLPAALWTTLPPWHKYRVRVQAVHELAAGTPVFARESAAQIMGLPLIDAPQLVHTVVPPGQGGGRSSAGIRRLEAVPGDPDPWVMFGLRVTPPVQTARDLALRLPLARSLPAMDKVLSQKVLPGSPPGVRLIFRPADVEEAVGLLPTEAQRGRVRRVLAVANGLSQSAGESWSRAIMIQHGFPTPRLQVPFRDARGLIGYPDFDWEEFKVLGEFDGQEKYSQQRFLKGKTPAEAVVAEKNRENRLRALGYTVVRWEYADLRHPERLVRLLHDAGLPHA